MPTQSNRIQEVYLDHAAATPLDKKVWRAMQPFLTVHFGNPSSLHRHGRLLAAAIEKSRIKIATLLGTTPDTIVFTSGGTESTNTALFGIARALQHQGKHVVTTPLEHAAVREPLRKLAAEGWKITYLPVDRCGRVDPEAAMAAIRPDTTLISIMSAHNEIGTIQPIAEIGRLLRAYRLKRGIEHLYFHTDACQTPGYMPLQIEKLHVDFLSLNAEKMYGPPGVGLLYIRRGVPFEPLLYGGGQEKGRRSGTENTAGIVGLAEALVFAEQDRIKESARLEKLSIYFFDQLKSKISGVMLNGAPYGENRLPHNIHVYIPGIEGEVVLLYLDAKGISCSTGSACAAQSGGDEAGLLSLGLNREEIRGSLRFTLGRSTTKSALDYVIKQLVATVTLLRHTS